MKSECEEDGRCVGGDEDRRREWVDGSEIESRGKRMVGAGCRSDTKQQ